jgi:hypothetical protein
MSMVALTTALTGGINDSITNSRARITRAGLNDIGNTPTCFIVGILCRLGTEPETNNHRDNWDQLVSRNLYLTPRCQVT